MSSGHNLFSVPDSTTPVAQAPTGAMNLNQAQNQAPLPPTKEAPQIAAYMPPTTQKDLSDRQHRHQPQPRPLFGGSPATPPWDTVKQPLQLGSGKWGASWRANSVATSSQVPAAVQPKPHVPPLNAFDSILNRIDREKTSKSFWDSKALMISTAKPVNKNPMWPKPSTLESTTPLPSINQATRRASSSSLPRTTFEEFTREVAGATKSAEQAAQSKQNMAPRRQNEEPTRSVGMKRQRSLSPHQGQYSPQKILALSRGPGTALSEPSPMIKTEPPSSPLRISCASEARRHIRGEHTVQQVNGPEYMERARAPSPAEVTPSSTVWDLSLLIDRFVRNELDLGEGQFVEITISDRNAGERTSKIYNGKDGKR